MKNPSTFTRKPLAQAITGAVLALSGAPTVFAAACGTNSGTISASCTGPAVVNTGTISALIVSAGTISGGGYGVIVEGGADDLGSVSNAGTILGTTLGILIRSSTFISDLTNTGIIDAGSGAGIAVNTGSGVTSLGIVNSLGGTITGGSTGILITDASSVVSGGITNNGVIQADGVAGIFVKSSAVINGDITNTGQISVINSADGIQLYNAAINGAIVNSAGGTISASTGDGIQVSSSATAFGIQNDGLITTSGNGIRVDTSATIDYLGIANTGTIDAGMAGISLEGATSNSAVSNSGTIIADATGIEIISSVSPFANVYNSGTISADVGDGIHIYGSRVLNVGNQDVTTGTITAVGNMTVGNIGIYIDSSTVRGSVVNGTGTIDASGQYGIYLNNTRVRGSVSNAGVIIAGTTGIYFSGSQTLDGNLINSGVIDAGDVGISVVTATVIGDVGSSGTISANDYGIKVDNASVGSLSNSGTIQGGATTGIYLNNSTVSVGDVANSGYINASNIGIYVYDGTSGLIAGSVLNTDTGTIDAGTIGIHVYRSSVGVDVGNQGTISLASAGTGILVNSTSSVAGNVYNSGSIDGGRYGINVDNSTVAGLSNDAGGFISASTFGILAVNSNVNGDVTNSGSISAGVAGIWLDNDTISGSVLNTGGTIGNGSYGLVVLNSNVTGDVGNTGTIGGGFAGVILANSNIAVDVSNSGLISGGFAGLLMATTATVSGNITNDGTISGGSVGIFVDTSSTVGDISNSGTISGGGAAIVDLSGTLANIDIISGTYIGPTSTDVRIARIIGDVFAQNANVNITAGYAGSVFTSEGDFDINQFNIASGAAFSFSDGDTITSAGGVTNDGTMSLAESALATIVGDYTQSATGLFEVAALDGVSAYGQLHVTGQATIDSPAFAVVLSNGTVFADNQVLNVIVADAGSSHTGLMTVTDNSLLWEFTAEDNANGFDIRTNLNAAAGTDACGDDYCKGAAGVIVEQLAAGNPDFGPYGFLSDATAFKNAASAATPGVANENMHVIMSNIDTVLDVLRGSAGQGDGSSAGGTETPAGKPQLMQTHSLRGGSSGDAMMTDPGKAWLKPYQSNLSQTGRNTVDGYNSDSVGLVMGSDTELSEDTMVGGAIALGTNNLEGDGKLDGQSIESDVYQGIVYANKDLGDNTYVAAQGLLGVSQNDSVRKMPLFSDTARASYDSWFTNLRGEVGRDYEISDVLVITPSLNASYVYVEEESYTEHGSTMDLHVNSRDQDALLLGADVDAAYTLPTTLEDQYLVLTARLGFAYDVLDNESTTKSNFVSGGAEFTTDGIEYDDVILRGGVGLKVINGKGPLSGSVNYDASTGNDAMGQILSATVKYKF